MIDIIDYFGAFNLFHKCIASTYPVLIRAMQDRPATTEIDHVKPHVSAFYDEKTITASYMVCDPGTRDIQFIIDTANEAGYDTRDLRPRVRALASARSEGVATHD